MEKDFLQSQEWRKFQENAGKRTFLIEKEGFSASIIEHKLPIVGKYFYVPRGPVFKRQETRDKEQETQNSKFEIRNSKQIQNGVQNLISLAKENNVGWIRVDIDGAEFLDELKRSIKNKIVKAPHDMQPREIFMVDITKSDEELLAEMKPKTRYNIRLAEKRGIIVNVIIKNQETRNKQTSNYKSQISNQAQNPMPTGRQANNKKAEFYIEEFLRLTKIMAERQGIVPHSDDYYRKMFEMIPGDILKLYVAEYEDQVVAANLVVFYGKTCTYLHGASDDKYKNLMAPYLLQWQAIRDAKKAGCEKYDFGGVKTRNKRQETRDKKQEVSDSKEQMLKKIPNTSCQILDTKWAGITKFKLGFSPKTEPTIFFGSYDIIISPRKYFTYFFMQKIKKLLK